MSAEDVHAQAGAYALDALDDAERRAFERHLRRCDTCRQEVRDLVETTALLGSAAGEPPPDELRASVLHQIGETRQLPPLTGVGGHGPGRAGGRLSGTWTRGATIAAAACLALAVAFGVVAVRQHHRAGELAQRQQRIAAVLSAPDARVETGKATPYGTGMLVVSHDRGKLLFALTRPRSLTADRTYQLWFMTASGKATSAGLLDETSGGAAYLLAATPADTAKVGVTIEPAGGSAQPTSTPIMLMPLA